MCGFLCGHRFLVYLILHRDVYKYRTMTAGLYGKSLFSFVRDHQAVLQKLYHFAFLPGMNESSYCFTSLPAFGGVGVLDLGHSDRCVVVLHCCFCSFVLTVQIY